MSIQTIEDINRNTAFNRGCVMVRDSGMNSTEIEKHINEIEQQLRIKYRHLGLTTDELERAVESQLYKNEFLEGAKHQSLYKKGR